MRRVARTDRVANVGAGGKIAVVVGEGAVEHQELFAAGMFMGREPAARGIAAEAGRARDLVAVALQQATLDAGERRGDPWQRAGRDDHAPVEIGVELHGFGSVG